MATSDIIEFHTEERSNLKRFRERDVDLSNKRLKMCEETGYFLEVRSEKNVGFFERNGISFWRSSYRSDRLNHYGDSNGRNRCVKSRIESKRKDKKEEDGKKEKTDEIEEFLDWQPASARMHSNEGFEVSVLNGIEAPVKDGEVVEAVSGDDEGVKIAIGNNDDHEIPDENYEDYQEYEDYEILDENNDDHEIEENSEDHEIPKENKKSNENKKSKKIDEALNRKLKVFEVKSYAQTNNCGNFLISVKMFCFNLFFYFRFIFDF